MPPPQRRRISTFSLNMPLKDSANLPNSALSSCLTVVKATQVAVFCRKKEVPYCIIKGKARLGTLVHQKTATCVALTTVRQEDNAELGKLAESFKGMFNENVEIRRRWGGGIMGQKSQHVTQRKEKA
eukprot:CAMPEP_0206599246 /NCGR_PEP_ID=MMETSP0325_2-20121206/45080_1 /ASSEMBLY_ACC=CAM_ASM_000347 /TAXON_ID=2866 /ORGANISM="Crypthecodinium cohnii, Strain Seligo" /LENGTH=126 /DNA_ID=CAMNT_0054110311 /DNA_START=166 /DNA_END=543 /DNA_ORIENTATION=-